MPYSPLRKWIGRIRREVGEATGDRGVEAKGAVESRTGQTPSSHSLDRVTRRIRKKHGDVT
jgi:uncharacterized protein YjbJ (UPF0337 family)